MVKNVRMISSLQKRKGVLLLSQSLVKRKFLYETFGSDFFFYQK